jgi:cell fate (sporulation/competence/biofilm development) regulator YlbF (YheA/YmcA/DUF963 family)
MEEILLKADELGRLIRETDTYRNYQQASGLLSEDPEAVKLLEKYITLSGSLKERQDSGDIVEKYETEDLESLICMISENGLIMRYLEAQQEYLNLLVAIQNEIRDREWEEQL